MRDRLPLPLGRRREGRRRRRALGLSVALVSVLTSLALVTTTVPAAQARTFDRFDYADRFDSPGADVRFRTAAVQSRIDRTCLVSVRQSFEVLGAPGGRASEPALESAIKRGVDRLRLDLSGGAFGNYRPEIALTDQSHFPSGYLIVAFASNSGFCPDVLENDYHRRLGAIGQLGKTVGAIVAGGIVAIVVTAALTVLAAEFFPAAYTRPAFIAGIACVANAMGIFTTQSILGTDGVTKAVSALAVCAQSVFGESLQTVAKWFSERRAMVNVLDAADANGVGIVQDEISVEMQNFLRSSWN